MNSKNKAIILLRNYNGFGQKYLSEKLEIAQSHLSNLESGKRGVSIKMLEKYSKLFDITVIDILQLCYLIDSWEFLKSISGEKGIERDKNENNWTICEWAEQNDYL